MKKITLLSVMGMLCLCLISQSPSTKALTVGDAVPDIFLNNLYNYKSKSISLSTFNDKLVILDFWATWCGSCVKQFPKLYTLQQKYAKKLQILLVNSHSTGDDIEKATSFLKKRAAAYILPSLLQDTILEQLFPHTSLPHYVWIMDGKVFAITDSDALTNERIEEALTGKKLQGDSMPTVHYDFSLPLFKNGNGGLEPDLLFKSFLSPYIQGVPSTSSTGLDDSGLTRRVTFTNSGAFHLYSFAYPELSNFFPAKVILQVAKPEVLDYDNVSPDWKVRYLYNYEAQFPARNLEQAQELVRSDLKKFFGYKIIQAEKEMTCNVLKLIDAGKSTNFPASTKSETNLFENSGLPVYFNNYPISSFTQQLEMICKQPFIDETGLTKPVKLSLPANVCDITALQTSLAAQGLLLSTETRRIPVIIITDK